MLTFWPGFGPFAGALLAAGFFKILKLLEYQKVNGHQDKSGDEEDLSPLLARQTDEIEKQLRAWGPRARRNSDPESLDYSPRSPHSSGGRSRSGSGRYRDQPRALRLYRLSGLEPYMSKEDLRQGQPVMREFEYTPTQSRYARSNHSYSPEERPQRPREWWNHCNFYLISASERIPKEIDILENKDMPPGQPQARKRGAKSIRLQNTTKQLSPRQGQKK